MNRRSFLQLPLAALGAAARRPNMIVILADDVGYSDIGSYGGEVHTPNLDRLAKGGLRFTQFYNCARCCPSRAALLTGLHPHQAGMGNMVGGRSPLTGYRGQLKEDAVTIPQVLRGAGYSTYMAGKWHLGQPGPVARGFDDYYGMLHGFDSFWDPSKYTRLPAGRPQRTYADGKFYATGAITDHALDFLAAARQRRQPYFLYLAYNAAHFPLHAPKDLIDKYAAVYEKGWDAIRARRFARLRELGIFDKRWQETPRSAVGPNRVSVLNGWDVKQNPAWDTIDAPRRADLARRMAIFAAMIEAMDRNIGRVLDDLEKADELAETFIVFLSDNGACAEWDPWGFDIQSGPDNVLHSGADLAKMGQPGTYHSYGSGWANASNTPWRLYKHYIHEGGIATPLIAHWPAGLRRAGALEHQPGHIIDLLPTCAALAGAAAPAGAEGADLAPALHGRALAPRTLAWEHEGNRALRDGRWKLVAVKPDGPWELYDMETDRTEMRNLAAAQPARVKRMAAQWEAWARRTNALPWMWQPQYGEVKQ